MILILVDTNGKPWVIGMAAGPAILAFVLVFLDDGITWHLINHPSHKLKHGDAYNYDTIVIGFLILVNSLLGFPWLVAATVRSLNHIHAMAEKSQDGTILSVQETRLTNLGIHLLCFITIFALDVLKLIPVPVLYGVFLFMGLVSLGTNQFWGRMMMFFMQPSKYPVQPYTQYMTRRRMHYFTLIQLFFFALLYVVKSIKAIAIAFPIIIAACIPVRLYLLPKIFTRDELILIDSDPNTVKMWIENRQAEAEDEDEPLLKGEKDVDDDTAEDGNAEAASTQDIEGATPPVTPLRPHRKKTVSCPTGALMFTEQPSALGPRLTPQMFSQSGTPGVVFMGGTSPATRMTTLTTDGGSDTSSVDTSEGLDLAAPSQPRRARPSRAERRSLSCPQGGMMFAGPMDFSIKVGRQNVSNVSEGLPTLHEANHSTHSSNSVAGML